MKKFVLLGLAATTLTLANCSGIETEAKYPTGADRASTGGDIYAKPKGIFGSGGLVGAIGGNDNKDDGTGAYGIAVNSYLWRASLDTVSFLPIVNADPFGGVILSDWYTPIENDNERFKANAFILSKHLRSDGVRVRVFKQRLKKGAWVDAEVADDTARKIEDAILTRARQLRVSQSGIAGN